MDIRSQSRTRIPPRRHQYRQAEAALRHQATALGWDDVSTFYMIGATLVFKGFS